MDNLKSMGLYNFINVVNIYNVIFNDGSFKQSTEKNPENVIVGSHELFKGRC